MEINVDMAEQCRNKVPNVLLLGVLDSRIIFIPGNENKIYYSREFPGMALFNITSPANWAKTCAVFEQTDKGKPFKRVKMWTDIHKYGQILKQTYRQKYGATCNADKLRDIQKL